MGKPIQSELKKCTACGRQLPLSAFNRATQSRDGRAPTCRRCETANRSADKTRGKDKLRAAIKAGDIKRVKSLVATGTKPVGHLLAMAVQNYNTAPKHEGHLEIVDFLLASGAKPDRLAIFEAARDGNRSILERLIAAGAELDIFTAAATGDPKLVTQLLKQDPQRAQATASTGTKHYQDFSALHCCCMSALARGSSAQEQAFLDVAKLLVENGAEVDARAKFYGPLSVTPLEMAAHTGGNLPLCRYLIERGAKISGFAFVEALSHRGRNLDEGLELATLFLEKGFPINAIAWKEDGTALHGAANAGSYDVALWLLERGADVNAQGRMGRTPLHLAAERNTSTRTVEILLQAGADLEAKDDDGFTPLQIAYQHGKAAVARHLEAQMKKHPTT